MKILLTIMAVVFVMLLIAGIMAFYVVECTLRDINAHDDDDDYPLFL